MLRFMFSLPSGGLRFRWIAGRPAPRDSPPGFVRDCPAPGAEAAIRFARPDRSLSQAPCRARMCMRGAAVR